MRNLSKDFENRTIDYKKLVEYGFLKNANCYVYERKIYNDSFKVVIELSKEKKISRVIDLSDNEEYILVDVISSTGDFVGNIKQAYENILNDIIENCCTLNRFKNKQSKAIIKYIKQKYNDDLEYLWEKFPNYAVCRNERNNKWYGVIVVLSKSKLGLEMDEMDEMIILRYQKDKMKEIINHKNVFEGYHMNKANWITVILDGSIDIKEICKLIDNSYNISLQK